MQARQRWRTTSLQYRCTGRAVNPQESGLRRAVRAELPSRLETTRACGQLLKCPPAAYARWRRRLTLGRRSLVRFVGLVHVGGQRKSTFCLKSYVEDHFHASRQVQYGVIQIPWCGIVGTLCRAYEVNQVVLQHTEHDVLGHISGFASMATRRRSMRLTRCQRMRGTVRRVN